MTEEERPVTGSADHDGLSGVGGIAERLRQELRDDAGREAGAVLDARTRCLVQVGIYGATTTMLRDALESAIVGALAAGATQQELVEVLECVTVLGMHTWGIAVPILWEQLDGRDGVTSPSPELEKRLRKHLEEDPYWREIDAGLDGIFNRLVTLSPELAKASIALAGVPWQREAPALSAKLKELVYIGIDASPTHLYEPGLRFHIGKALEAGATVDEITEVLALASLIGVETGLAGEAILTEVVDELADQ